MAEEFAPTPLNPVPQPEVTPSPTPLFSENNPLNPEVAHERATQADFGLKGKIDKSYQQYYDDLVSGQEEYMRNNIVTTLQEKDSQRRALIAQQATLAKGSPLSAEEYDMIGKAMNDPRSVIEDHFSKRYMDFAHWPENTPEWSSWWHDVNQEDKDRELNIGTEYLAKKNFLASLAQDADEDASRQSWLGWGWDQAKNLTTVYPWYQMHVSGTPWWTLPGTGQEIARTQFLALPYEQMKDRVMAEYTRLKEASPTLAKEFAHNLLGMSSSEQLFQDVLPLAFPGPEIGMAASLGKGALKATVSMNTLRTAVRDMLKTPAPGLSPAAAASAAAGDLSSTSMWGVIKTLASRARHADPMGDAISSLPSIFKIGQAHLVINPGTGDRAIAGTNALIDEYNNLIAKFPQLVTDLTRAEALPSMAEPTKEALDAAKQIVRDQYRHINNRILNVSEPVKDPVTGHWYVHIDIGESPIDYFGTAKRAAQVAKENGLGGWMFGRATKVWTPGEKVTLATEGPIFQRTPPVKAGYTRFYTTKEGSSFVGPTTYDFYTDLDKARSLGKPLFYYDIKNTDTNLLPRMTPSVRSGEYYSTHDVFVNHSKPHLDDLTPKPYDVQIRQQGLGYYIRKTIPLPSQAAGMRDFTAKLETNQTPTGGILNSFLARFRTPNETLAAWQTKNREISAFGSSTLEKYAWEQAEAIRKLAPKLTGGGGKKWDDWERILNNARFVHNPDTGKPGYTYKNIGELQYAYMKELGRLPDEQEVKAYFAFKRINEMDHVLRTISIVRNKVRFGTMSHRFSVLDNAGKLTHSDWFDAIPISEFPTGTNHTIAIIGDSKGQEKIVTSSLGMGETARLHYEHGVKTGKYKMAQLYAPSSSPLGGFGKITNDHQVVYVIAKNMETRNLDWAEQLPFQGGGHFVPKYYNWIKQIQMKSETIGGKTRYYSTGVKTLMPVINEAEGEAIIGHFEKIRTLLQKATMTNIAAARDIVENTLHMNWDEVYGYFRSTPKRGKTGFIQGAPPVFNLTEPFQLSKSGQNLLQTTKREDIAARYPKGEYREAWRNGGDISLSHAVEFSQERDWDTLMTLNNKGTIENPAYAWEPAKLLDAIPTMNRAFNKISNSFFMDDYKFGAIEQWLREAREYLNVPDSQLRSAPLYWFHHGEFNKAATADAQIRMNTLDITRQQIKQFIGQVSQSDALVHAWTQKLADTIYRKSPGIAQQIDPAWTAHTLTDPTRFVRAVTFHSKMGLFSIPQLLVQGSTYVNIFAISGASKAMQGTTAAMLHWWAKINPSMIDHLDRYAVKLAGWSPGEFKEAYQAGHSTGFFNVGTEYALRDDPMSNKIIKTRWGQFLDLGSIPFKYGEQNVRFGSWYTAYKEFRETKPTGILTNKDKLDILNRASLLNGNMNRASNALYQRGFAALPAQFLTYTIRQAEMLWGKRLTGWEKARLLITNAAMYGVPIGVIGAAGLPSDFVRERVLKDGYTPGENYISTMINEGIPSTILGLTTGRFYNIGERFGPKGPDIISDVYNGDKSIWEMATGAAGSEMRSIWETFDPFRQYLMSFIRQDAGFKITMNHVLDIAKEASSFNNSWKAAVAAATGKWMTKNGQELFRDITPLESLFMYGTGLQPQAASDVFHMTASMRDEKELAEWAEKRFIKEFRQALKDYDDKNPSSGQSHFQNAFTYLHVYIPDDQWDQVLSNASQNDQTLIERVRQQFGTRHVPPGLQDKRFNQFIEGLKQQ